MVWQAYRWVWRLESPLHMGLTPAGFLNRTRLYIPARAMWGALTATLARQAASGAWPDYQGIGKALQEQARFSYLYPAEWVNDSWQPWLPCYEAEHGRCWQRQDGGETLPDRAFRRRLLATHPGTAIDPASDTAAEGTLREVECILPHWRSTAVPVAFVGYVCLQDGNDPYGLTRVQEIALGGETRYGFGRMRREQLEPDVSDCFGIPVDGGDSDPILQNPRFVWAHTLSRDDPIEGGAWELVLGWDRGSLFSGACEGPCWAPGSRAKATTRFRLLERGVWQRA
jgi:hypothetical protein